MCQSDIFLYRIYSGYITMSEDAQFKLRLPQDLKEFIESEAKANYRTINGEIIYRLEQSRQSSDSNQADIKVVKLENGRKRLIYGKFVKVFGVDYSQDLVSLQKDLQLAVDVFIQSSLFYRIAYFNDSVYVYKGDSHIDIVVNGKGSLNWLRVEDHITDEYMEKLHQNK